MGKSRAQTRIDPDTESRVEEYAADREIGQSEALRRLIHTGLDDKGYSVEGDTRRFDLSEFAGVSVNTATFVAVLLSIVLQVVYHGGMA